MTVPRRDLLRLGTAGVAFLAAACSRAARQVTHTPARSSPPAAATSSLARTPSSVAATRTPATTPANPVGPAVEYAHGPRSRREVALTFHGDGDPGIARELLAIFAAHRAKVTVLAVGRWLEGNRQIAHEIVAAGHELGNHTYNHLDIDNLAADAAKTEIERCRDLLVTQVGSAGAHFRPSQTQYATPLVRRLAGAAGYGVCLSYDIDSLDYTDPGAAAIRRNVATTQPGSIVSMHFGHAGTVEAMPAVLIDLAARGLRPVTASQLLRP
ncbi:MAG: polysaccharide deacetylase [Pseudonocardiales bacterium]|nr:polysaccharide deacetylase [Pseudonocardiales bacterium]